MKFDRVICEYERRMEDELAVLKALEKKRQHKSALECNLSTNNNNNNNPYNILENDTLVDYGTYNESWSLDSAASGQYCGKKTKIKNRKPIKNGKPFLNTGNKLNAAITALT
jgi:hypothetical protein